MQLLEGIFKRRSIRSFIKDKPVETEKIETLLKAAMSAPSAGNQQPWHFIVIDERKILDEIPEIHPYAGMSTSAPLAILVCGDVSLEKHKGFWVQDCAASIENMLLATQEIDLEAVWCGIYPNESRAEAFKEKFNLPKSVYPLGLVVIGYSDKSGFKVDRYRKDRIHSNRW
ncbi:nitroreductase [Flexistipes sinusarabici DSM 4947]|uniref:Nitroreductase n=1 Tax=Flexistipes sinusarabici (strain ATCC 49648 / DSM 4947 / MAS 10) TaxID=717231 RepID=F8E9R6_FLESM|nr:nitroreductase family protein [Flexistipes sinusarabici]AEI14249.1 nitroreductase [Flexistipes sinusarabici DSM 4947]